jgi:hypothetical protein
MWLTWGKGELRTEFWWGNWEEGDHFEGLCIERRLILKHILIETGLEIANSIQDTQDIDKFLAVLNVVMNILFPRNAKIFYLNGFQE